MKKKKVNEEETMKEKIERGLEQLAFGDISDAIRLLMESETLTARQIKRLNLFNVAGIKRSGSGITEVKFFDRLKAIERLAVLGSSAEDAQNNFLEAILSSARADESGQGDEEI